MNLSSTIKSIQDIMRKDDGIDGDAQRIGQLTWMLFLKVFDQREEEWEDDAIERSETYISPLPDECRWRNWAQMEEGKHKKSAEDLINFVNNKLFPKLKEIHIDDNPMKKVIRQVFEDSNNYMKSGTLMLGVIEKLEDAIKFHDFKVRQHLGDIYEQILNDLRSAGNAGEFYTPRAITRFMVDMVSPQLKKREKVLDPACGTGGFLTAAIEYLRNQLTDKSSAKDKRAIEKSISGIEKKQLPHLLCTTNLLLNGIDIPSQIDRKNTLAIPWGDWRKDEKVDCVVTNPPFGGMEDDGVGADYPTEVRGRETADMFMTLISRKLLKKDGRAAVVLPDGFLFGEGIKNKIKGRLLKDCNLHTIVRLPNGVFNPYTGIKTNLLFFTNGKPTETIWFYEHPYPKGYKSYSKTKPIRFSEFEAEKAWWGKEINDFAEREENEFAWRIDFKSIKEDAEAKAKPYWEKADQLKDEAYVLDAEIKTLRRDLKREKTKKKQKNIENQINELKDKTEKLNQNAKDQQSAGDRIYWPIYNLDIKNPNSPEAKIHDPDELLKEYKDLLKEIEKTQNQLKDELSEALSHHFEGLEG